MLLYMNCVPGSNFTPALKNPSAPVLIGDASKLVESDAGAHGKQMPDGDILLPYKIDAECAFCKQLRDFVIEGQKSVVDEKSYGESGDAFASENRHRHARYRRDTDKIHIRR